MTSFRRFVGPALVVAAPAFLLACSSDDSEVEGPPPPDTYTFDTFNIGLAGSFVPFEQERRSPGMEALAAAETDIVCVQEAWRKTDKDLLEAAVKDRFPYIVRFEHNFDTPVDDPTDQEGNVPPAPTTAPCGEPATKVLFEQIMACLAENCSTIPGSNQGKVNAASCAEEYCLVEAAPLLTGNEDDQRCYGCAVTSLPEDTLATIHDKCTTIPNAALAFDGQSGVMILSRYPLVDVDDWVLPATWNRRIIARATAQLPNGVSVDVYCNHLAPIFFDMAFPYTGQYGEGKTGADAWGAEQKLQAAKLVAYADEHSGDRPAIILGDFNAGHEFRVDGHLVARAEGDEAASLLDEAYDEALVAGYTPQCTFCSSNPVTGLSAEWESAWIDHLYLRGIPLSAVKESIRTFEETTVKASDGDTELEVPVSDHYGMRAVIELKP